jgi:hypothetical protein
MVTKPQDSQGKSEISPLLPFEKVSDGLEIMRGGGWTLWKVSLTCGISPQVSPACGLQVMGDDKAEVL